MEIKWTNFSVLIETFQAMITKLPDKGEKLRKRIVELNLELAMLKAEKENNADLYDFTSEFQRVLNV
jgi:hypothetical protein